MSFDSKQFKINGNAQKALCSCPDEPLDLEFSLQALRFDADSPFNITAKLVTTPDETICDESAGDAKVEFIKFSDSEKRSLIVEVGLVGRTFTPVRPWFQGPVFPSLKVSRRKQSSTHSSSSKVGTLK